MTEYVPIPCGDYEVLETACLYQYEIELTTDNTKFIVTANRLDVRSGEEHLVVTRQDGISENIRVDRIRQLVVRTRPAHFMAHTFKPMAG